MISKWIILDEIELKLIKDNDGDTIVFNTKEEAIEYGDRNCSYCSGWQVVEVPFGNN